MSTELGFLAKASADRERWLSTITKSSSDLQVIDEPEMPVLVRSWYNGFLLPPDFPWPQPDREEGSLIVHVETRAPISLEALGDLLVALQKGLRREARRSDKDAIRLDIADLAVGSVFLRVVLPVASVVLSLGSFVNGVYATFHQDNSKQRGFADVAAKVLMREHADAVTMYSSDGVTLRVDRPAAESYVLRRTPPATSEAETTEETTLPEMPLAPLALPTSAHEKDAVGSAVISEVGGRLYIALTGREGSLVLIEDDRRDQRLLQPGLTFNVSGHFDFYPDGLARRFVLTDARRI